MQFSNVSCHFKVFYDQYVYLARLLCGRGKMSRSHYVLLLSRNILFLFAFFSPSPNVNMFFSVCHQLFVCFPQIPMTKPPSKNCAFVSSSYTCCVSLLMAGNTSNCTQQPIYHKRQHPKTIGQLAGKQNSAPRCSSICRQIFLFCFVFLD